MERLTVRLGLALAALAVAGCAPAAPPDPADLIVVNARVFTPDSSPADAVAIRGNRIALVGGRKEVEALAGKATWRMDAGGASLTPGFNDAHVHFLEGSLSLGQVDLLDAETLPAIETKIRGFAAANPAAPWVLGRGWLYGAFPGGLPTRAQLDLLVPDRPAVMNCYDGHTRWLNSKALAAAGITRHTRDPANGVIVRDASGEPTGVLKEAAQALVDHAIPEPTREARLAALRAGIAEAQRFGVTSVLDAGVGAEELDLFDALRTAGQLGVRMSIALQAHPGMAEAEADQLDSLKARHPGLTIGAVKFYADGVIEAHTASMLNPWTNAPGTGLPNYRPDDLTRIVTMLDRRGWQILIHAIGDRGIRMSLDAIEAAQKANPAPARGRRHRLEHIEDVSADDIARFGKLGVIASMQPFHASPNGNVLNVWAVNVGPERAARAWSWKSIYDAGGKLAFGTDWPVVGIDPRPGMHTALTRTTAAGAPPGGFGPAQRLPLRQVLETFTSGSAYAEFADSTKGLIKVGMLADLVIWDRDLFAVPVDLVKDASVVTTVFDGKVVYRREPRAPGSR